MAYTKIHAIKATVDKAIDYICNPEKTDEKMFVSSYACSPETAAYDFKYTLDHCRENSPNKAYHLIQAFAPGEVGFEEAHHIGKELADKLLEGKYSYVVTTHIDKGTFIITSFFALLTTSNTTNITTANSPITTFGNLVMNCARNTIFPSSFRVPSVAENTKNGSPTRMVLRGKRRSERTSISVSSRLPLTKNFCF